jgi:hypothetical protein
MANKDLRDWISGIEAAGELKTIKGAEPKEEIGGFVDIYQRKMGNPALMFDEILGFPKGHRVIANILTSVPRINIALGLPPQASEMKLIQWWRNYMKNAPSQKPNPVNGGPLLDNVREGKDVNIQSIPTPVWHETDRLRGILSKLGAVCEHHRDGLTNIAHHIIGQHRLGIGYNRGTRPSERDLWNRPVEILRGDDGVHARHRPGRSDVDCAQPAMRHGAAHNGGMPLPWPYEVVDILAAPAQVPQILDAIDRAADEGVNTFHEDC